MKSRPLIAIVLVLGAVLALPAVLRACWNRGLRTILQPTETIDPNIRVLVGHDRTARLRLRSNADIVKGGTSSQLDWVAPDGWTEQWAKWLYEFNMQVRQDREMYADWRCVTLVAVNPTVLVLSDRACSCTAQTSVMLTLPMQLGRLQLCIGDTFDVGGALGYSAPALGIGPVAIGDNAMGLPLPLGEYLLTLSPQDGTTVSASLTRRSGAENR